MEGSDSECNTLSMQLPEGIEKNHEKLSGKSVS
jgi:hypothetical protein